MLRSFDCPKCGAPLNLDPQPGAETAVCPFCSETVIIPEDIRVPLPDAARPFSSQSRRLGCAIAALVLTGAFVVLFIIGLLSVSTSDMVVDYSTDSPAPDTAAAAAEAKATAEALQPLLKQQQNWPAVLSETFLDNSRGWKIGDTRDSFVTGNRSISDGIYSWIINAVQSTAYFCVPDMPDQKDFYASVDLKYVSMPDDPDADAGIFFRYNSTNQTWYYFSINNAGQYYFGLYDGASWSALIPETTSSAIHLGETNRLAVGAQGAQFIFVINGQMVDYFINHDLQSGSIGLGVNLPKPGQKAVLEYSNFSVLAPAQNP